MSEHYVSLDPKEQDRYIKTQRSNLVKYRKAAAAAEPFGSQIGGPFAMANGFLAYHIMSKKNFKIFPLSTAKATKYGIIIGVAFIGFHFGRINALSVFKDQNYSVTNARKREYLKGNGPLDPPTLE